MGTSVIANLDSQVWKMLGIDAEDTDDKNKNNRTVNKDVQDNKIETEKEQLKKD